jgi:hypothetical protein
VTAFNTAKRCARRNSGGCSAGPPYPAPTATTCASAGSSSLRSRSSSCRGKIRELGCQGRSNLLVRYLTRSAERNGLQLPRRAIQLLFIRTVGLAAGQRRQPGPLRRCTADPGRRWPPNAVDHPRPALRPRFGRGPGLDIQAATAALNLRSTRLARRGQHRDPDDQAANAGPRQLRPL